MLLMLEHSEEWSVTSKGLQGHSLRLVLTGTSGWQRGRLGGVFPENETKDGFNDNTIFPLLAAYHRHDDRKSSREPP